MKETLLRRVFSGHPAMVSLVGLAMLLCACDKAPQTTANGSNPTNNESGGQKIQFNQGGNSEHYRVSGWSHTETDFTWTEGTSAKLELPVTAGAGPWILKVSMSGLIQPPQRPSQLVEMYANDQKIAEWQVGNVSEFTATIPAEVTKTSGALALEFRTPNATSPKALGMSEDTRILGVCVRSVELTKG